MKTWVPLLLVAAAFMTAGCIDSTVMVSLNEDGSGHVIETTYMSAQAIAMMGSMGGGMGGGDAKVTIGNPLMDEAKAKAKVAQLGEGVTFVSLKEITKADGSKGARATYKFADINKITVSPGDGDNDDGEKKKADFRFVYKKGNLTVTIPKPEADEPAADKPAAPAGEDAISADMPGEDASAMPPQMMAMFQGMRMRLYIKTPKPIKSTNAKYVSAGKKTGKKTYVTLLDFNLDKLLAAPGGMAKFQKMQSNKDQAAGMKMLEGVEGIKIETAEKLSIKF